MKKHTKIAGIALLTLTGTMLTVQAVAHDRDHERCHDYRGQMGGYMGGPGSMPSQYWNQGPWMNGPFEMRGHQSMPFRGHRHMDSDYADMLADRLDLTKEQRVAMEDIAKKSRREMRDLWEERQDNVTVHSRPLLTLPDSAKSFFLPGMLGLRRGIDILDRR